MAAQQVTKHYHKPWQLLVSVCLTRLNTVSKELNGIEQRYATLLDKVEQEQSAINDYEFKKIELLRKQQRGAKKKKISEADELVINEAINELESIKDLEDIWKGESSMVALASRERVEDDDQMSVNRHLDQTIHMVVEDENLLKEKTVVYPYSVIHPKETLRKASERLISEYGINNINNNVLFLSNGPIGLLKIRFDENEERGELFQGAKVFFTKAQLTSTSTNNLDVPPSPSNDRTPKWVVFDEFKKSAHIDYVKRVEKFAPW